MAGRNLDEPAYYRDYLHLERILSSQRPLTSAHDELLFISVHQVYELWFKQILHEIDSVRAMFKRAPIDERDIALSVRRLQRVKEIFAVLLQQIGVLETMSPLDFLSFRDALYPASGFQSSQFRLLENRLGLSPARRVTYGSRPYCTYLDSADAAAVTASEGEESLLVLVEAWLERTPFLAIGDFEWWKAYQSAVSEMLASDEAAIRAGPHTSPDLQKKQIAELEATRKNYASLFDRSRHDELVAAGERTLSYTATQAALLITLYGQEPMLSSPAALLALLVDVDESLTLWRYRHALMVHRMLGVKMGTGGSSGYHYLRVTAERHKVFADLSNLSTFLIPRTALPALPQRLQRQLDFSYRAHEPTDSILRPDSPVRQGTSAAASESFSFSSALAQAAASGRRSRASDAARTLAALGIFAGMVVAAALLKRR